METKVDFDEWLETYTPQEPQYVAVFETLTGAVKSVGPSHAFENENNKIFVDRELAESIIAGIVKIGSCIVDPSSNTLEISEVKNIFKIDDVLHRIISKQYSTVEKNDLYVIYDSSEKTLIIELSEEYGGTKLLSDKFQPVMVKKIIWDGDTEMDFLITEYNDPNILYQMISVKISSLIGSRVVFHDVNYTDFSVYTRRLFKNCVIEYK